MAKTKTDSRQTATDEPEFQAFAIVRHGGLWLSRTLLIQGDRVQAYTDSEPDTKNASLGRVLGALRRVE